MAASVLLTGATGFIGRAVARRLSERGHELSALVRGDEPAERLSRARVAARAVRGSLDDAESLKAAVRGAGVVVHAAAIVDPALKGDEAAVLRINRDRTLDLARLAREAGVRRFIFVSSIAAVGFWSGTVTADSPCRPADAYGRSKLEAERGLLSLRTASFEVVIVRPPTVYGPGEPYNLLAWVRAVERGFFRIIGAGDNALPLCTTENLAVTIDAAVEGRLSGGVFMVGDAEPYPMTRIHAAICSALGMPVPRLKLPKPVAIAAATANEIMTRISSRVPSILTRARVNTLTVDQRLDLTPLMQAGVVLRAPLEEWMQLTVSDYERRGLVARRRGMDVSSGARAR